MLIDLTQNPERFTGYKGEDPHKIWSAIYEENCFHNELLSHQKPSITGQYHQPNNEDTELCYEKKIFFKLISGMHTSISLHLCKEYLDPVSKVWVRLYFTMERSVLTPYRRVPTLHAIRKKPVNHIAKQISNSPTYYALEHSRMQLAI